jgi:hypothetical protein
MESKYGPDTNDRDTRRVKEGNRALEGIAREALDAFRHDAREAYERLVREYEGSAAVVGVFGLGSVTVAVRDGEVHINPEAGKCPKVIGHGATYPETVVDLAEGRTTVLKAFHAADLVVRVDDPQELHRAYSLAVEFTDPVVRSDRLQHVLRRFRDVAGC